MTRDQVAAFYRRHTVEDLQILTGFADKIQRRTCIHFYQPNGFDPAALHIAAEENANRYLTTLNL